MKKSRLRSVGLGRNWKQALDRLARQVVFARDGWCQWCNSPAGQMQWAHIRSRRYLSTRWSTWNSLVLCGKCHLRWHHEPLVSAQWFEQAFPERAQKCRLAGQHVHGKIDKEAIKLELEQELRKYE